MAGRQNKVGLDYFELDCHMDEKVRLVQAEYGLKGFAVFVKLLQEIYGGYGYYCEWTQDLELLFASENGLSNGSLQLLNDIVAACIRRNIFSERLFTEYGILTSSGVQKQYLKATVKREVVELKKEYLLITIPINRRNVVINSISDTVNSIYDTVIEHSKEEKSREENNTLSKDNVCRTHVQRCVEAWNSLSDCGIHPVSRMLSTSNRYKWLNARIEEYGIDDVLKAIESIRYSSFLRGHNNRGWMIDFEWFVRPNNFPKVLEGKYIDRKADDKNEISNEISSGIWGGARQ